MMDGITATNKTTTIGIPLIIQDCILIYNKRVYLSWVNFPTQEVDYEYDDHERWYTDLLQGLGFRTTGGV